MQIEATRAVLIGQRGKEKGKHVDTVIAKLDAARTALIEAKSVCEVKQIVDAAVAAEIYARRQRLGEEAIRFATEIKLDAQRKLGGLLRAMPKNTGAQGIGPVNYIAGSGRNSNRPPTLADLGIDRKASAQAQFLAGLPDQEFEAIRQGKKTIGDTRREYRRERRIEQLRTINAGNDPLVTARRYPVIYADPPWRYEHPISASRDIENQYPTLGLEAIKAFPVAAIAHDNCVLFLWATPPKLAEAMQVIGAWGFNYRTCAVWDKRQIGMGYFFRQQHELLLVAVRGTPPMPAPENRRRSVFAFPRGEHSAKPNELYGVIESMYPNVPKIELFARSRREGWDAWGNQAAA